MCLFPGGAYLYLAGGEYPDGNASRSVWRYDPCLDTWDEMQSMQTPRSELGRNLYCFLMLCSTHSCSMKCSYVTITSS